MDAYRDIISSEETISGLYIDQENVAAGVAYQAEVRIFCMALACPLYALCVSWVCPVHALCRVCLPFIRECFWMRAKPAFLPICVLCPVLTSCGSV